MSDIILRIKVNGEERASLTNPKDFNSMANTMIHSIKEYAKRTNLDLDGNTLSLEIDLGDGYHMVLGKLKKAII